VVFGRVTAGHRVLDEMEAVGTKAGLVLMTGSRPPLNILILLLRAWSIRVSIHTQCADIGPVLALNTPPALDGGHIENRHSTDVESTDRVRSSV